MIDMVMARPQLFALALWVAAAAGCAHQTIPNTHVPDTAENREIIDFVEKYRQAVEDRDIAMLLRMISFVPDDRVLVDLLYTGWFKLDTPEGPQWRRRLEPHRIVLAREDGKLLIMSGM